MQSNGFNQERIKLVLTQNFLKNSSILETQALLTECEVQCDNIIVTSDLGNVVQYRGGERRGQ